MLELSDVKKLGFGCMRLPLTDPENASCIDLPQVVQMAELYMERGFSYFDTAYPYHGEKSEEAVREALVKRFPRESFLLADKMPVLRVQEPGDYPRFFEEQLRRCGVDYFDVYLLHNLGRDRYINTQKFGGFEYMERMRREGHIRYTGFSFHDDAETLDRILTDHPEVDYVQLQINYLDWDSAVAQSRLCYETAVKHGKKVIVMEPVKGGTLAKLPPEAMKAFEAFYKDKNPSAPLPSPASLAVRYAASLQEAAIVLSGMSDLTQMRDNTDYMESFVPLSPDEQALAGEITQILNRSIRVPCTSCRYCMEQCPMNINIPEYFGLLNLHAVTGKKSGMYYNRFIMNHGKASECIKCGLCEEACPQHIAVRDCLAEFAALYEE